MCAIRWGPNVSTIRASDQFALPTADITIELWAGEDFREFIHRAFGKEHNGLVGGIVQREYNQPRGKKLFLAKTLVSTTRRCEIRTIYAPQSFKMSARISSVIPRAAASAGPATHLGGAYECADILRRRHDSDHVAVLAADEHGLALGTHQGESAKVRFPAIGAANRNGAAGH